MGRMRRGWELTKKSWGVIRSHPGLVRFPIYGGLLALLFGGVFMVPGAILLSSDEGNAGALIGGILLVVIGAYLASFFIIYFNVALAAAADQALRGEVPDLRAARGVARSRIGVIASWALVSALVSAFFAVLRDRAGALGGIASAVGAAIWSLVTFLVVPVLAFEGIGPFDAIKRSAALFRQRWGQQVTGNLAIGGIAILVSIVAVAIGVGGIALMASDSTTGEVTGGILLFIAFVIGVGAAVFASATKGVFGVALYRYVADDATVGPFTAQDLESAAKAA